MDLYGTAIEGKKLRLVLNIPLFAQLYKQLGQLPSFSFPQDDMELNILSKTLIENIKQTATQLY